MTIRQNFKSKRELYSSLNKQNKLHFNLNNDDFKKKYNSLTDTPNSLQLMKMYKIACYEYYIKNNEIPLLLLLNDYPHSRWCILLFECKSKELYNRVIITAIALNIKLSSNNIFHLIKQNFKIFEVICLRHNNIFDINVNIQFVYKLLIMTCDGYIKYDDFVSFILKIPYILNEDTLIEMAERIYLTIGKNLIGDVCNAKCNNKKIFCFNQSYLEALRSINNILPLKFENIQVRDFTIEKIELHPYNFPFEQIIRRFVELKKHIGFNRNLIQRITKKINFTMIQDIRYEFNYFYP